MASSPLIAVPDLPADIEPQSTDEIRIPGSTMAEVEKHMILKTLEACNNSTSKAAEMLGISVRTIQYRLKDYGLAKSDSK